MPARLNATSDPMPAASGRILIVDDEPLVREALAAALSPPNHVITAGSGLAALEVVGQQPLDIVLLDYVLPDVSGLAIARMLRQCFPRLHIILMTGFGSEDVCLEAFRGGVQDYLKKPISLRDLKARVASWLGSQPRPDRPSLPIWDRTIRAVLLREPGSRNGGVQRAVAFIDAHLDTDLSLDQVAREAGMSKFHFCRHFKSETGLTFREYLAQRRIARAAELLSKGNRAVSEVYLDVGFKDLSHFGRVFRKITGQAPSRYRRIAS
jgi:YesN/AraC family two-component response regulator